ncbi:transcriptional regulator MalT [Klebsiella aerogenes]|nr:transcriptional regulator MalT [Klebsiella aerogenes]
MDEVLDNVDARTRNFLLKSSLLRSMNDALIVRVTGEENGQMQLEEIERQGYSCSGWMIPVNGSAITRCLAASCASVVSGSWRLNCRRSTALRRKAGWRKGSPARPFIMLWPLAMPKCCAISYSTTPGHV